MDLERFLAIEKQYALPEKNIDGFFFWTYARAEIAWYIRDRIYKYDAAFPQEKKTFIQKSALRAKMICNALLRGCYSPGQHDVVVLNSARRVWMDDHYECVYSDDIVKELKSTVVLEGLVDQKHYQPVNTPNLYYLDGMEVRAQLCFYFHQYFRKKEFVSAKNRITDIIEEPLNQLALAYCVDINCADIVNMIIPQLFKYQSMKNSCSRMLKKIMPKVVLEVNADAMHCMVMTETAKEYDIPVVELQHGVMGKSHIVYNYPSDITVKQFPDYLFVFSDYWKWENRCPIPDRHIIPVGFPYLEKQKLKYPPNKERGKVVILFLSQGMISGQFAGMAAALVDALDMDHYKIIFKLHPGEYATWKEKLGELQDIKEIEVVDNSAKSIYEYFAIADIQIGYTSTSVYEGLSYNLDTYIYRKDQNPETEGLVNLGYARGFTSGEELIQLVNNRDKESDEADHAVEFWTRNAMKNIKENVSKLISGEPI